MIEDVRFLRICLRLAHQSRDPNTQIGAVIVSADRKHAHGGWNHLPRGIRETPERMADREYKLGVIIHAEVDALLEAASEKREVVGSSLYLLATDKTGACWGGPPCLACASLIIQAGVTEVVSLPFKDGPSAWRESIEKARALLTEAGVFYREADQKLFSSAQG